MPILDRGPVGFKNHFFSRTLIISIVFSIIFGSILTVLVITQESNPPAPDVSARISYTVHSPISINGNAQFNHTNFPNNGVVSGNGTVSNPYIIEDWDINSTGTLFAIYIFNTTAHFKIMNCYLHNADSAGIRLTRVSNGSVINNDCINNKYDGIILMRASNNTIINNRCFNNSLEDGILLTLYSVNNTIANNVCVDNVYGIDLDTTSNHNVIFNNTCESNACSIYIYSSRKNIITNNICSNSSSYGLYIFTTASSSLNMIWNNTFYHNNGAGDAYDPSHLQAFDSGANNWWNSTSGYGNWWSDLTGPDNIVPYGIVDWSYNLTGSAGAKDYYPLTNKSIPPYIPEFSDTLIPIAGLMLIALVFGRVRKQREDS